MPSNPPPEPAAQPAATSGVARVEVRSTTASIEERANDAAYQEQLGGFVKERQRIVKRRAKIESRMAPLRELAKKALPADATEEQVVAELEGNPRKYPGWRELVAARKESLAEEERSRAAAQAAVARRISRKEQTDHRAQGAASAEK